MLKERKLIPIYTTQGELGGFLRFPYIYNPQGEWIGYITRDRDVYSVHGIYVGKLSDGPRILRKREWSFDKERITPPRSAPHIHPPAHVPLAPQMPEIMLNMIDVLDEAPELLQPVDYADLRDDMD
jgi:hypothetical protein